MLPPAPGRLSITNGWASSSCRRLPRMRESTSLGPPGVKATIRVTGRSGYSTACAGTARPANVTMPASTTKTRCNTNASPVLQGAQMADRTARCDRLGRRHDRLGVDAVVAIEVGNRAGLAEMLDAERPQAVTVHSAEPGERRRVAVEHGDHSAMGRQVGEEPLDMRAGVDEAALAGALRRGPAGIESVRRGDGEEADIAAILGHQSDRLDRLRRNRPGIGDDHLAVRSGPPHPVGAVDDRLLELSRH